MVVNKLNLVYNKVSSELVDLNKANSAHNKQDSLVDSKVNSEVLNKEGNSVSADLNRDNLEDLNKASLELLEHNKVSLVVNKVNSEVNKVNSEFLNKEGNSVSADLNRDSSEDLNKASSEHNKHSSV